MRHFNLHYTAYSGDNLTKRLFSAMTRRNIALGLHTEQTENPDTFHVVVATTVELPEEATKWLASSEITARWNYGYYAEQNSNPLRVAILQVRYFADGDKVAFEVDGEYFAPIYGSNKLLEQIIARNIAAGWQPDPNEKSELPKPAPKSVLPKPPPIYVEEQAPLLLAAKKVGGFQQVQQLLTNGANPNAYDQHGRTALMYAVLEDNLEIIDALLNAGANPKIEFELKSGTLDTALRLAFDRNAKCKEMLHHFAEYHEPFTPANLQPYPDINQQEIDADVVLNDSDEGRWENSNDFQYRERDNGQFGSFPLHEDYSDES